MSNLQVRERAQSFAVALKEGVIDKPMHFTAFGVGALAVLLGGGLLTFVGAFVMGANTSAVVKAVKTHLQ